MAKNPTFTLQKRNGKLMFSNRGQFEAWVAGIPEEKWVRAEFKMQNPDKTHEQLKYWYGVVVEEVLAGLKEAGNDSLGDAMTKFPVPLAINKDDVDRLLKKVWQENQRLEKTPNKASMTKEDMSNMIDFILNWAAQYLRIVIPEPRKEE